MLLLLPHHFYMVATVRKLDYQKSHDPWPVWLNWLEQKVSGSIPDQGAYPGCGLGPRLGAYGRKPISVSLS